MTATEPKEALDGTAKRSERENCLLDFDNLLYLLRYAWQSERVLVPPERSADCKRTPEDMGCALRTR